jgi:hypothetical protein
MSRDDIIRMARDSGALQVGFNKTIMQSEYSMFEHELERFAALVAAAEREACAALCDARAIECDGFTEEQHASEKLAEDIRARGQA